MKALTTLLSLLAVAGAIASASFFYISQQRTTTLESDLEGKEFEIQQSLSRIARLEMEKSSLEKDLNEYIAALEESQATTAVLSARNDQLARESKRFTEELDQRVSTEEDLQSEIVRLNRAIAELRVKTVPLEEIGSFEQKIANLESTILQMQNSKRSFPGSSAQRATSFVGIAPLPRDLTGKILTVGPQSSFVILNLGYESGVRLEHSLAIRRGGEPIARIQITEVKENLSIARILPESLKTELHAGDLVSSDI